MSVSQRSGLAAFFTVILVDMIFIMAKVDISPFSIVVLAIAGAAGILTFIISD